MSVAEDAALCATMFAVDPFGLGGVCLRSLAQPARDQWLDLLRELLPSEAPMRRIPCTIADGRLLGGLDLLRTLQLQRPVLERGVLAAADGGVVVVSMAERLSAHTAACINGVLDAGEVMTAREGLDIREPARIGLVALDESLDDEHLPASLLDRCAFLVDLHACDLRTLLPACHDRSDIDAARVLVPQVVAGADVMMALCATALALGAGSPRVAILALRAAKILTALDGRTSVTIEDAAGAARLVFAPRATQVPADTDTDAATEDAGADSPAPSDAAPASPIDEEGTPSPPDSAPSLNDLVLAATVAAVPPGLLAGLRAAAAGRTIRSAGRAGAWRTGGTRGRPCGVRGGAPDSRARLSLMETLRAAAPWQMLRRRGASDPGRVRIEPDDFRFVRYRQRAQTLTIFAVDASGSSALNRLAETKGAVELLLAECYVRRDQVAVVSFRGRRADILLPPTRSLVRAKRGLAGLPGGGGTPLAAGIEQAAVLALQSQRRGETPTLVLLTDGRANVTRDGMGGRERAQAEALQAARLLRVGKFPVLLIDTSPRPNAQARDLACAMDARYVPLPFADARALSRVVTAAVAGR